MPRPDVFLSYASADSESVLTIALKLKEHAVPVFLNKWSLIPGQPWVDDLGGERPHLPADSGASPRSLWAPRKKQLEVLSSGRDLTPEERRIYLHE